MIMLYRGIWMSKLNVFVAVPVHDVATFAALFQRYPLRDRRFPYLQDMTLPDIYGDIDVVICSLR